MSEDEEQGTIPLVTKRKRSSPARARTFSAPQVSTNPSPQNAATNLAPSPDEDDHLTIKKLKVQHSIQTPIQPSQPQLAQIATSTPEIMNLDDFDKVHDLQGLRTSIFNKFPSLFPQTTATSTPSEQLKLGLKRPEHEPRVEQPEQSIVGQTIDQIDRSEHRNTEQIVEQTTKPITTE